MNAFYTTCAKTSRWSVLTFYYMLDTIRVNAKTLWCIKHKQSISTFDIAFELANALVMPFIEQRNLNSLWKPLLKKINYVLNNEEPARKAIKERKYPRSGNRQRCRICLNWCKTKPGKDRLKKTTKALWKLWRKYLQCTFNVYVMIVTKHRLDISTIVSFIVTFLTYCLKKHSWTYILLLFLL